MRTVLETIFRVRRRYPLELTGIGLIAVIDATIVLVAAKVAPGCCLAPVVAASCDGALLAWSKPQIPRHRRGPSCFESRSAFNRALKRAT